ncbi:MAG: hypothetical protein HY690_14830 [Chloroflexi bacterium]|nr:hypothetical protein [Chloroflexota bacterium]
MEGFVGEGLALSDLVRVEEQGLDLNHLLFIRYLVLTRRLTDEPVAEPEPVGATA